MFRKFLSFTLLITLWAVFDADAQMLYPISDAKMAQLRGPVKSVTTFAVDKKIYFTEDEYKAYKAKGQELPAYERDTLSIDHFNTDGNYAERINAVFGTRDIYMYFQPQSGLGGKILSVKHYTKDSDKFETYYSFNYDRATGYPTNAKKIGRLDPNTMQNPVIFEESSMFETKGDTIIQYHTQSYPDGRVIVTRLDFLKSDHSILSMSTMQNKVLTQQTFFTIPNDLSKVTTVEYTNPDYMTISVMVDDQRIVYKKYSDGTAESVSKIKYNKYGDKVSVETVGETNNIEYEYDTHGNWTRRMEHSQHGQHITEREITYYE